MDMTILLDLIDNGFAIFVAIYFMWRLENRLQIFSNKIENVGVKMDKLSKTILLLVINEDPKSNPTEEAKQMYNSFE